MIGKKAVCLICLAGVAVFKEYDLKRHFETKHGQSELDLNLSEHELEQKTNAMITKLIHQQGVFNKLSSMQEDATKASFMLSYNISKRNKPFSHAEFVKECIIDAVSVLCSEVKSKVGAISLSRRTVVCRIDAISKNLLEQLIVASGQFEWYSLALDESTNIQDTAQLLIFIRGVN